MSVLVIQENSSSYTGDQTARVLVDKNITTKIINLDMVSYVGLNILTRSMNLPEDQRINYASIAIRYVDYSARGEDWSYPQTTGSDFSQQKKAESDARKIMDAITSQRDVKVNLSDFELSDPIALP